jgi:hypothetical protein
MTKIDVTKAIEPKSDQLNADDLLTGPRTIRIREVKVAPGQEQPVWIYFDGDDNKPWKSCKTATRTLAAIWGADASKWIGLSLTLYCDPEVTWGGAKVGGIRVSHMEGLSSPRTLMLTKTRGKKGATVIKPLAVSAPNQPEQTKQEPKKDGNPNPVVDRTELKRQMDEIGTDAAKKKEWWGGLTDEEKAVVKELASTAA